nr:matrixin family metalloprotease [Nocardioides thalensis]
MGGGRQRYVTGSVTLDTDLDADLDSDVARGVLLHELGHLVGLDHVSDRDELMYADGTFVRDFGPGDREGLVRLGEGRCF